MSGGGTGISYKAVKLELARLLERGQLPSTYVDEILEEAGLEAPKRKKKPKKPKKERDT